MKIIIDTTKVALLTAIAWTFAGVGVAVTRGLGFGWHAASSGLTASWEETPIRSLFPVSRTRRSQAP